MSEQQVEDSQTFIGVERLVVPALLGRYRPNVQGGPNWTPAVADRARNDLLVELLVELGQMDEREVRAQMAELDANHWRESQEHLERLNREELARHRAEVAP